jgi:hypothetical protein
MAIQWELNTQDYCLCDMMPYSLAYRHQCFGGICCFHSLLSFAMKMEAAFPLKNSYLMTSLHSITFQKISNDMRISNFMCCITNITKYRHLFVRVEMHCMLTSLTQTFRSESWEVRYVLTWQLWSSVAALYSFQNCVPVLLERNHDAVMLESGKINVS